MSLPTRDEHLAALAKTMMSYSDTSGDHHMLASMAIEQLRSLLQPTPKMRPDDIEKTLSQFRDVVDEKVIDDECEISLQWNFIAKLAELVTPEQLQQAFSEVIAEGERHNLCEA